MYITISMLAAQTDMNLLIVRYVRIHVWPLRKVTFNLHMWNAGFSFAFARFHGTGSLGIILVLRIQNISFYCGYAKCGNLLRFCQFPKQITYSHAAATVVVSCLLIYSIVLTVHSKVCVHPCGVPAWTPGVVDDLSSVLKLFVALN